MPYNPESNARLDEFLKELNKNGLNTIHLTRSNYLLNKSMASIRTTTKPGPIYWYDISKNNIDKVDYFIYQMDTSQNFTLFPSSFFKERYNKLQDSNRANAKIFYIDWKNKLLVSKPRYEEDIKKYCCSTNKNNSYGDWLNLSNNSTIKINNQKIILNSKNCLDDIEIHKATFSQIDETEKKIIIDSRIGQNIFRDNLIKKWGCCSVTGCKQIDILIASHIKPWSSSNNTERLDINNGLLLIPNLDKLFDQGYISFDVNGQVRYSSLLNSESASLLGINKDMRIIDLNKDNLKYLDFHREHVFKS